MDGVAPFRRSRVIELGREKEDRRLLRWQRSSRLRSEVWLNHSLNRNSLWACVAVISSRH